MNYKKQIVLMVGLLSLMNVDARRKKYTAPQPACGNNEQSCKDLKNPCQCYCAFKPGPRDKVQDDKPVFVEDDPDGIYCYCKQRDIDKHLEDKRIENE